MMNGPEKSDSVIVAKKPANKAGVPVAERVERRAGTKGVGGCRTTRISGFDHIWALAIWSASATDRCRRVLAFLPPSRGCPWEQPADRNAGQAPSCRPLVRSARK